MGVLKENRDYWKAVPVESDETQGIVPGSEDESETASVQGESDNASVQSAESSPVTPVQRPRPRRVARPSPRRLVSMHGRLGRRQRQRIENLRDLYTLVEEDEFDEVSLPDLAPRQKSPFSRLLSRSTPVEVKAFEIFTHVEECFNRVSEIGVDKNNKAKEQLQSSLSAGWSAEEIFECLDKRTKSFLTSRHLPLGLLDYLEASVVEFFKTLPNGTYYSEPCSSFDRLILHGIAAFHRLRSISTGDVCERKVLVNEH